MATRLQPWVATLETLTILAVLLGMVALGFGLAIGWALVGCAALPAMAATWYKGELMKLPPAKAAEAIDDMLDSTILGQLRPQPSPYDLATIVATSHGGQFMAARLGLGSGFLQQLSSHDSKDAEEIWQEALLLKQETGSPDINGALLVAAIVRVIPAAETLLAHLQLDLHDLSRGIQWYDHIESIIQHFKTQPRRSGGIGRDWAFGWIPLLGRFGHNLSDGRDELAAAELEAHQSAIEDMLKVLGGNGRKSVGLVGSIGVGKSEVVRAFAHRLMSQASSVPSSLAFRQVFMLDASSLIAAAPGRGELEHLVEQLLAEAYAAKNIILCLDNAHLFFEDAIGSVDLTNLLLPIIEAGRLPIILTLDQQRFIEIAGRSVTFSNAFHRINLDGASEDEVMRVMQDHAILLEYQHGIVYMYQALKEAYRLGSRYISELAMPGKAVTLLEAAAQFADGKLVSAASVGKAIESKYGIKVRSVNDQDERDKLLNLEQLLHERMVGQDRAVSVISDALRRARAGVRNENRPIGAFLFLGPTGVGKTELAKALAAVYFGGEERIIRLDMNEYVTSDDVTRLIADAGGNAMSLAAQIKKQPFSVVLMDEIEKAHPNVLTALLQLLDEGVLRDEKNREISFKDAIIIATSNAHADRIREYIDRGYRLEQFETTLVNELLDSGAFKPEFINRFDDVVVFQPLTKDELLEIVDHIIGSINKTLAGQKITVTVSDDARRYLVEAGYDPRLGARPMRRVVQRAVENTVAKLLIAQAVAPGGTVMIDLEQVRSILESKQQAEQIAADSAE
ncbi:MAG: hypothetical protein JWN33_169 [Candidatus Saccharibacteria bacterium]|nr:hypothetical protein [Candidatus Saccharibacteria bacterium]